MCVCKSVKNIKTNIIVIVSLFMGKDFLEGVEVTIKKVKYRELKYFLPFLLDSPVVVNMKAFDISGKRQTGII